MRKLILSVFLWGAGALAFLGLDPRVLPAQIEKNAFCPVMVGERVKDKFYVDYEGRRIYLCCKGCKKAFKKRPEKYLKNLPPREP